MDGASVHSLPLRPLCYGKPRHSSQSSLIPILTHRRDCFGCLKYNRASLSTSPRAAPNRNFQSQWRHNDVQLYYYSARHCNMKLHRSDKWPRNINVRSDITGAAAPEFTYPKSELQLGSKVRGIYFYAVTAVAAIFLFVLMVIGHPFVLLFDRYRRKFHYLIAKIWASITISPFFKVKFEGLENLPPSDAPAVYVSNHQSFLDIYTLLTLGRSFKFISKTGIFIFPIIGWAMFLMGVIPLKRMDTKSQMDCLKRCIDLVKKGASVFFFPEGTRSKDGKLGPFKKGAFTVASKTGVPVVPITLMGTGKIMPAGAEGYVNHGNVRVIVHKPIQGSKADILCNEARSILEDSLNLQS